MAVRAVNGRIIGRDLGRGIGGQIALLRQPFQRNGLSDQQHVGLSRARFDLGRHARHLLRGALANPVHVDVAVCRLKASTVFYASSFGCDA